MFRTYKIFILIFMCGFFLPVFADLEITEIMYDPDGTDTNREWVEVYNSGSDSVDIGSWYFYENETYHGLTPDGFSSLSGGEYALIVKDVSSARSELGSGLKLVKSSFSLNNTGEKISLANETKTAVDSTTYDVGLGAAGDGKSLQKISNSWAAYTATPGSKNKVSNTTQDSSENSTGSNSSAETNDEDKVEKIVYETFYKPELILPEVIVAQSDFDFKAQIRRETGPKEVLEIDGYYYINFGDGNSIESDERMDKQYRYRVPGNYTIVFEYYSSRLAFDAGEEPLSFFQKNINVLAHDIVIVKSDYFNGVVLKNNTKKRITLDNWKIVWKDQKYSFPRHSYVSGQNEIAIIYDLLGFAPSPTILEPIRLMSNANKPVDIFPKYIEKKTPVSSYKKVNNSELPKNNIESVIISELNTDSNPDNFFETSDSYLADYLADNPDKLAVDFGSTETAIDNPKNSESKSSEKNMYYALGALLLMLGSARVVKYKMQQNKTSIPITDKNSLGDIEVIE